MHEHAYPAVVFIPCTCVWYLIAPMTLSRCMIAGTRVSRCIKCRRIHICSLPLTGCSSSSANTYDSSCRQRVGTQDLSRASCVIHPQTALRARSALAMCAKSHTLLLRLRHNRSPPCPCRLPMHAKSTLRTAEVGKRGTRTLLTLRQGRRLESA